MNDTYYKSFYQRDWKGIQDWIDNTYKEGNDEDKVAVGMFTHEIAGKWIEYAYKKGLIKHDSFLKKWWREFKSEENEEKDYWN